MAKVTLLGQVALLNQVISSKNLERHSDFWVILNKAGCKQVTLEDKQAIIAHGVCVVYPTNQLNINSTSNFKHILDCSATHI